MRFYKYLPVVVSLSLLASCGGGGGSSDSSGSQSSSDVTVVVDTPVDDTSVEEVVTSEIVVPEIVEPEVEETPVVITESNIDNALEVIINNSVVSEIPTEFFTLSNRVDFSASFEEPISFTEFFDTVFEEVLLTEGNTTTTYEYDSDDNLATQSTVDNASEAITTETTFNYTFNSDGQVINRESIRELFSNNVTTLRVTNNIGWVDGNPVSLNTETEIAPDTETATVTNTAFTYQTNDFFGQLSTTMFLEDDESTLIGESTFFAEVTETRVTNNEIFRSSFDSETGEVIRLRTYIYDTEVFIGDNVTVLLDQRARDGLLLSTDINFYIHFGDFNQTLLVTFDNTEFTAGEINSFEMSRYTYDSATTCGDYEEMATIAFNILDPTCITNLTFAD